MELKDFLFLCYYCKNAAVRKKIFFSSLRYMPYQPVCCLFFAVKPKKNLEKKTGRVVCQY